MIFEKIRERLEELSYEEYLSCEDVIRLDNAIDIINQVEAEYTCENCVEKGKCSIYDNADIKYCSDCRPNVAIAKNATPIKDSIMNHFTKGE